MKKEIAFTAEEKLLLSEVLAHGLTIILSLGFRAQGVKVYESALAQMSVQGNIRLTNMEIAACNGCLREALRRAQEGLIKHTLTDWLHVSAEQKELMRRIDCYRDILKKCERRKGKVSNLSSFRYRQVFGAIRELQQAAVIALAWNRPDELNKIAFISQNEEIAEFDLKQSYTGPGLKFYRYPVPLRHYLNERFSAVLDRPSARQLVSSSPKTYYPKDTITFFQSVLQ